MTLAHINQDKARGGFSKYGQGFGLSCLFLLIFLLRLYKLGSHDFWYDEIGTINYAQFPWHNWNAPLYWIFLHFWIRIFGISEFSLRFPSLIFSFFSVIVVFFLGRDMFNKKTGIIASLFIGLSAFHLWYAQEARDYSMVLCLATLSSWLFIRALREDSVRLWIFFVTVSLLGIYTNYFYIFLIFAQCLYIIFLKRLRLGCREVIIFLAVLFGFSLYLPRFFNKFSFVWGGFWLPKPTWKSLIITLENFILGYNGETLLYLATNILSVILLVSFIIGIIKGEQRKSSFFCFFLLVIPVFGAFFFSRLFFSVYLDRGLIIFTPYYYLILAYGLSRLPGIMKTVVLTLFLVIFFQAGHRFFNDEIFAPFGHHVGTYIKKPIKPIVRFFEDKVEAGDIVAFANYSTLPSVMFYMQPNSFKIYYFFDPKLLDTSWCRPPQESEFNIPLSKITLLEAKRIWVVYSNWSRDGGMDENSHSVKVWLDKNFKIDFSDVKEGLWICRYLRNDS